MITYQRLNFLEREEISRCIASGTSIRRIADCINRSPSTVSREIRRTVVDKKYYRAVFAHGRSRRIRHQPKRSRKLDTNIPLRNAVLGFLAKNWSPEQIAKKLWLLYSGDMKMCVSHETIYAYIYVLPKGAFKRQLIASLRRHHRHRRKKDTGRRRSGAIQDYLSIEERPACVADRTVPGHWEGDLLQGARNASAIGTLVERTTRMAFLVKLNNRDAMTVRKAFAEEFRCLPEGLKRTLTYDQGQEMLSQHKLFTKETDITVYFAHPHSPWERGTNENTNSLLRQYFPKGTDFSRIPKDRLKEVQDELNDRPRKTLGWHTPHEKFSELLR